MNKKQLTEKIFEKQANLPYATIDHMVKEIFEQLVQTLIENNRIEIRGFGSFCLHHRSSQVQPVLNRIGDISFQNKYIPYFKASKEMRKAVKDIQYI